MGTKTGINTIPTDYQAALLLAALDDEHHRIPRDANGRTLDLMYARQWVKEYTATGKLAAAVRDYPGFTHFRLTHHGINAARRVKALRDWSFIPGGFAVVQEDTPIVKVRELVTVQGVPRRDGTVKVFVASAQTTRYVPVHHIGVLPVGPDALSLPETAAYVPQGDEGTGYRDVVILQGPPDAEGKIEAISGRYAGKRIRVPLVDLRPLPEPPAPAGEIGDWWQITTRAGNAVTQVEATDYEGARAEAEKIPAARAASLRDGGLVYRRLPSIQRPNA
ncbi:hypothetical protein [Streptomyces flaveus]|uniref:hypothetical protein n=1 Tax=Streptomyces flaveus TaxID=66370 RepID=UPI00332780DC